MKIVGYAAERLAKERSLIPLAALPTLDCLWCEPEVARAAIEREHDQVDRTRE